MSSSRPFAVPIVIDHFGEPRVADGVGQPGFTAVLSLVKSGKAYVKLSNADTLTRQPDMSDVTPYAKALIAANPQRVVFGTAWPHPSAGAVPGRKPTDLALHRQTDDGQVMNMLAVWAPDAAIRKMILVDNAGAAVRLLGIGVSGLGTSVGFGIGISTTETPGRIASLLPSGAAPALRAGQENPGQGCRRTGSAGQRRAIEAAIMVSLPTPTSPCATTITHGGHGRMRAANYIVTVPSAGEYLVTATKEGVGADQTKVAVQRSGLVTANLTLWKAPPSRNDRAKDCGTSRPIGAFERKARSQPAPIRAWLACSRGSRPCSCIRPAAATRRRSKWSRWTLRDLDSAAARRQRARDISAEGGGRARGVRGPRKRAARPG